MWASVPFSALPTAMIHASAWLPDRMLAWPVTTTEARSVQVAPKSIVAVPCVATVYVGCATVYVQAGTLNELPDVPT